MAVVADQSRSVSHAVEPAAERRVRPVASEAPPRRMPSPVMIAHSPVAADSYGALWWTRIPGRIWKLVVGFAQLFMLLAAILDAMVAASMIGLGITAWAWWTERITDDQVAGVLGQIGARGLAILGKSGVI